MNKAKARIEHGPHPGAVSLPALSGDETRVTFVLSGFRRVGNDTPGLHVLIRLIEGLAPALETSSIPASAVDDLTNVIKEAVNVSADLGEHADALGAIFGDGWQVGKDAPRLIALLGAMAADIPQMMGLLNALQQLNKRLR